MRVFERARPARSRVSGQTPPTPNFVYLPPLVAQRPAMVRWIYLVAYCPDPSLLEIWLNGKRSKFSKLKHNLNIDSSIPSAIWPSTDRSRFLQPGSYEARDAGAAAAARPCELGVGARSYGCLDVPFGPPGLRAAGRAHGGGHAGGGRLDVPDSPDVKHCAVCLESDRHLGPLFPLCCCSAELTD